MISNNNFYYVQPIDSGGCGWPGRLQGFFYKVTLNTQLKIVSCLAQLCEFSNDTWMIESVILVLFKAVSVQL